MIVDEVYSNPLVKQVIFQITFPSLFYIESKIGDLQLKIMKNFPKSALLLRKQIIFADFGPEVKPVDIQDKLDKDTGKKIWQFKSEDNIELNITSDSLDISSTHHKTYNIGSGDKFRDIIKGVLENFISVTSIPIINRIGLRYINECPIPPKTNSGFDSYYNSSFPFGKYEMSLVDQYSFRAIIRKDQYKLSYRESLQKRDDKDILILDYDAFANNIPTEKYLGISDNLHKIISDEFSKSIKEPVVAIMKTKKG
jgi:uncharacterized protein (TIGR04255 family)